MSSSDESADQKYKKHWVKATTYSSSDQDSEDEPAPRNFEDMDVDERPSFTQQGLGFNPSQNQDQGLDSHLFNQSRRQGLGASLKDAYNRQAPSKEDTHKRQAPSKEDGYKRQAPSKEDGYKRQGLGAPSNEDTHKRQGLGAPSKEDGYKRQGLGAPSKEDGYKRQAPSNEDGYKRQGLGSKGLPTQFGQAALPEPTVMPQNFATFEKYTKGIGSKLLMKMGYKPGQGLGQDGSGIIAPIDVKLRPQGMGLGHGGFDERTEAVKKDQRERGIISSDEEPVAVELPKDGWKKKRPRKTKKIFKSAEELLAEQASLPMPSTAAPPVSKIRDMTGKAEKELADLSMAGKLEKLAELVHNVRLLADLSESDLLFLSRKIRIETANKQKLVEDTQALEEYMKQEQTKVQHIEALVELIREAQQQSLKWKREAVSSSLMIELFGPTFDRLQRDYSADLQELSLDQFVVALIQPLFQKWMWNWEPLDDPTRGADLVLAWKHLLIFPAEHVKTDMTPYEAMLYKNWLPKVRHSINNDWDPHQPDPVIQLCEAWYPIETKKQLLPLWLWQNICYQVLIPKLSRAVEDWQPKKSLSVHIWLFPWLPVLGENLANLWTEVRRKFESAYRSWNGSDVGLWDAVMPWVDVFTMDDLEHLIKACILPGLRRMLQSEFTVNPANQDITLLNKTLQWHLVIPDHLFSELLEEEFFKKWHDALWIWIQSPGAKLEEISVWYKTWKQFFVDAKVQDVESVKHGFQVGLDMMNQGLASRGKKASYTPQVLEATEAIPMDEPVYTFTDLVEQMASEANLEFVPLGRSHSNGKALYKLGRLTVYLDRQVLFISTKQGYKPSTVDDAIAQAV